MKRLLQFARDAERELGEYLLALDNIGRLDWWKEATGDWFPTVRVTNNTEGLVLVAEVPGFLESDLEVEVDQNKLTITGKRSATAAISRNEHFSRSFGVPQTVALDKITATYAAGILTVQLPYSELAKPRAVQIQKLV